MASLISVGQVLDQSLEHCRKHYKELLALVLWMVVASIPSVVGKLLAPTGGDNALTSGDWLSFAFSLIGAILVVVVSIWMYATLTLTIAEQADEKKVNLKALSKQGWKIFGKYLLLTICLGLIFIGIAALTAPGYVLLFVGSIGDSSSILSALGTPLFFVGSLATLYLLVKYSIELAFAPYILLLEKTSVTEAIKKSIALVRGRWLKTAVRFIIPKILYFLALFVINYVVFTALEMLMALIMHTSSFGVLAVYTASLLLSAFMSSIVTPLVIATDYYLYDSLHKTR